LDFHALSTILQLNKVIQFSYHRRLCLCKQIFWIVPFHKETFCKRVAVCRCRPTWQPMSRINRKRATGPPFCWHPSSLRCQSYCACSRSRKWRREQERCGPFSVAQKTVIQNTQIRTTVMTQAVVMTRGLCVWRFVKFSHTYSISLR